MIEKHGQPHKRSAHSLTWFGLYHGKRTVVHRSATPEGVVEQVVLYRVPDAQSFRDRQIRLGNAGKSSRYRESLLFEAPLPVIVPGGEETAPTGKPLETP